MGEMRELGGVAGEAEGVAGEKLGAALPGWELRIDDLVQGVVAVGLAELAERRGRVRGADQAGGVRGVREIRKRAVGSGCRDPGWLARMRVK